MEYVKLTTTLTPNTRRIHVLDIQQGQHIRHIQDNTDEHDRVRYMSEDNSPPSSMTTVIYIYNIHQTTTSQQ